MHNNLRGALRIIFKPDKTALLEFLKSNNAVHVKEKFIRE
jgi:hypothetical protein